MALFKHENLRFRIYQAIFDGYAHPRGNFIYPPEVIGIHFPSEQKERTIFNLVVNDLRTREVISEGKIIKFNRPYRKVEYQARLNFKQKTAFYRLLAEEYDKNVKEQFAVEKQRRLILDAISNIYRKFEKDSIVVYFCANPKLQRDEDFRELREITENGLRPTKTDINETDAIYINFVKVLCDLHDEGLIVLKSLDSWSAFSDTNSGFRYPPKEKEPDYQFRYIDYSANLIVKEKLKDIWEKKSLPIKTTPEPSTEQKEQSLTTTQQESPYFDEKESRIFLGDKEPCKIRRSSSHYRLCKVMFKKQINKLYSWGDIYFAMYGEDREDTKSKQEKHDKIYFAQIQINKKVQEKLGIPKLFHWEDKQIKRLL